MLPLETDDVLALVLGEQAFHFPDHWRKPFLRNGPAGFYVWFDPSGTEELARYEKLGAEIASILTEFKRQGRFDEQAIRDVVERLNRLDPGNV